VQHEASFDLGRLAKVGGLSEMNKPLWELSSFECRYPVSALEIAEDDDRPSRSVEIFCAEPGGGGLGILQGSCGTML
jgi:hypothetical protein